MALGVFALRYVSALPKFDAAYAGSYRGRELTIEGFVTEHLVIEAHRFEQFGHWYPLRGSISVRIPDSAPIHYGDRIVFTGILKEPLRRDPRIAAFIDRPVFRSIQRGPRNFFFAMIFRLKTFLTERLHSLFPEPASSLSAGLLLGSRGGIPRDIIEDFKKTGLTHILAISGYNIVILIAFTSAVFSIFPRKISFALTLFTIFIFVILVGAGASVVRAAIMGSFSQTAHIFGRRSAGLRSLFITAYAMAFVSPFIVFFDIGFQLSFAATAGILAFTAPLKRYFSFLPNFFGLRDALVITWAAQIFTTPLIIFYFKGFSAAALFANVVILPLIPFLMLGSFLSLIFGKLIAAPTWLLFEITLKITHALAELPFAFIEFGIS